MASPDPSRHTPGAAPSRYLAKLLVVPDRSERWTTPIALFGNRTSGFSVAIAGSFQRRTSRWKIFAMVGAESRRSSTPRRLKATAIALAVVGTYRNSPAFGPSVTLTGLSVPAKSVSSFPNSAFPRPEPMARYSIFTAFAEPLRARVTAEQYRAASVDDPEPRRTPASSLISGAATVLVFCARTATIDDRLAANRVAPRLRVVGDSDPHLLRRDEVPSVERQPERLDERPIGEPEQEEKIRGKQRHDEKILRGPSCSNHRHMGSISAGAFEELTAG